MMQGHFFDGPGRADDAATLAELEVDYTPAAVAVQLLLALNELAEIGGDPGRCLCPSAGSGVWARAMRAAFGATPVIVGVDAPLLVIDPAWKPEPKPPRARARKSPVPEDMSQ